MGTKKIFLILIVLLICSFTACDSVDSLFGNPIIGKWSPKNKDGMISLRDIEFTKDMMIYGDGKDPVDRVPVKYEVHGNSVKIIAQAASFGPSHCIATEVNTITCNVLGGRAIYIHRE